MRLRKYHGLGNDFLIRLDEAGTEPMDAALARAVCDRHLGIGADGLIRVTRAGAGAVRMELRNADGGPAETSGNGLRCVVRAVVDAGWEPGPHLTVHTAAGPRRAEILEGGDVAVEMGTVTVDGEMVDVGNPHRVIFVDDLGSLDGGRYPDLNVEYVLMGPGPDEITIRIFERGVGETQACGSGACAAAAVAHGKGLVGTLVRVHQPGGASVVELDGDRATLTGPAQFVFEVEWPWR